MSAVFLSGVLLLVMGMGLRRIWSVRNTYTQMKKELLCQQQWVPTPAKILRLGYGTDYGYPGLVPKLGGVNDVSILEKMYERQVAREQRHLDSLKHRNILIAYSFEKSSKKIVSRTISSIVLPSDVELIYNNRAGDEVMAFVNPNDPMQSILRRPGRADMRAVAASALKSLKVEFAILALIPIGLIYVVL